MIALVILVVMLLLTNIAILIVLLGVLKAIAKSPSSKKDSSFSDIKDEIRRLRYLIKEME